MRRALAALALLCVGCSPAVDNSLSLTPEPVETYTARVAPDHVPEAKKERAYGDDIIRANADAISPDPAIMATMECEPVSESTLAYVTVAGGRETAYEPQQVLVGDGRVEGELWWVVALEPTGREVQQQVFLTTQPGVEGQGQWISLSGEWELPDGSIGSQFHNVRWDYDRLVRGQSALRKALDCL